MSAVDDYIKENAEIHKFAAEVARIISGIPQMPEFSNERITVEDVSKMTGIPVSSVRAGIVYGWLPVGGFLLACIEPHVWPVVPNMPYLIF